MEIYSIYKIECIKNGRVYIGQTKHLETRKREHRNDLRKNKHHSILFQRAYNKYGEKAFKHTLIEECNISNVDEREIYWIKHYNSTNKCKGFNLDGGGNANKIISPLTRKKLSENSKRNYYTIHYKYLHSPEVRAKKSKAFSGEGNPCYGKTPKDWMDQETYEKWVSDKSMRFKENNPMKNGHTEESRKKISEAMRGDNNPFFGKSHTEDFKEFMSISRVGENNPNAVAVFCITNGKTYKTITEARKELDLDGSAISKVCRGKSSHTGGYKFTYIKKS